MARKSFRNPPILGRYYLHSVGAVASTHYISRFGVLMRTRVEILSGLF
jgi:hypothetical protein